MTKIRQFNLTEDEKKDIWAKAIVSFVFIGMGLTLLFFFTLNPEGEKIRWASFSKYIGNVVNPAWSSVVFFLVLWFLSLFESYQYLRKRISDKSSCGILIKKIADKTYDLFPRLFLAMGGCIFVASVLECSLLPFDSVYWFFLIFQMLFCVLSSYIGFKMLLPRRLMLNILITGWVNFVCGIKNIFKPTR